MLNLCQPEIVRAAVVAEHRLLAVGIVIGADASGHAHVSIGERAQLIGHHRHATQRVIRHRLCHPVNGPGLHPPEGIVGVGEGVVRQGAIHAGKSARAEGAGIRPSLAELRRESPDLPSIPIHVLTAGGVGGPNAASVRRVHEAWQAAVARTPGARYTNIPTSGHQLPMEAPEPANAPAARAGTHGPG